MNDYSSPTKASCNYFIINECLFIPELQELLKIMGLPNWMNWMTWFFDAFFATFLTVGIVVVLICVEWNSAYGKIIMDSNWFMMFVFLMLYGVSLIWFKFALSTLFTSRKSGREKYTVLGGYFETLALHSVH